MGALTFWLMILGNFFVQKIERIHAEFDSSALETGHSSRSVPEFTELMSRFDSFDILNEENVKDLISKSSKKSCTLDPMPTSLVLKCQDILLPVITRMINLSLQSGVFCDEWKQALVQRPQLKKSKTYLRIFALSVI
ncbi:RNA-directed DNA polymerase from mobile element jockey [Paramuricea clavata]|uniref:RNA-directed DNA polymerase from mobile element jockey n=1 Tax=Paramuricea clavata TaxID=317549 RepID=A0A7D9HW02_PARCT|nr:RNA-directed DNA polymerase from mobile element jockey [Paramuricea clavata]